MCDWMLTEAYLQVRGYPTLQLHHNGAMVEAYRGTSRVPAMQCNAACQLISLL